LPGIFFPAPLKYSSRKLVHRRRRFQKVAATHVSHRCFC
jgi:hypothetical protein